MKIGIDARFFGTHSKGLGRYAEKLITHLEALETQHEYTVFLGRHNWDTYKPQNSRFRKVLSPFPWYSFQEQWSFAKQLHSFDLDLMHFLHFNVPLLYKKPFIVTIHDLILFEYPSSQATALDPVRYAFKGWMYHKVIKHAAKRAKVIITVSEHSKKSILAYLPANEKKVWVTYGGLRNASVENECCTQEDLTRWGIRSPYILSVGNAYPHKNLEKMLLAYARLIETGMTDHQLVFVGEEDYFYQKIYNAARFLRLKPFPCGTTRILFFGHADEKTLSGLYKHASLYCFPSCCEGFGLPPLEAMQYDIPVAASQGSCIPEILEDAAAYFDPHDPQHMAEVMKKALQDPALRQRLILSGRRLIQKYSWNDCAQKVHTIYDALHTESVASRL